MESLWHDLRFGLRTLERDLGFAVVAVLTLALGIGANAAVWSIARAAIFRTLPYESPEDVLIVQRVDRDGQNAPISVLEFLDIRQRQRSFEYVAMSRPIGLNISGDGDPERLKGSMVSSEFLAALGVQPQLGRDFNASDDQKGAPRTVLLSHELWQRRFGGDPAVLERELRIDGQVHDVIGVLPAGLSREILAGEPIGDLLVPIAHYYDQLKVEDRAARLSLWAVARLAEGSNINAAQDDLGRISHQLAEEFPATNKDSRFLAEPVTESVFRNYRSTIGALIGGALLVLLIACANLANLLLTRLAQRRGELATRLALGASARRVLRQLLTESLLLGCLGGAFGLLLAQATLEVLPRYLGGVEYLGRSRLDSPLVLTTMAAALLTSLLVCVLPAIRALRRGLANPIETLRARGSTRAHRLRWGLISVEVALAMTVLVGAGLLLETMARLNALDSGLDDENVLCLDLLLPQETFDNRTTWMGFFDGALDQLTAVPGVELAAVASSRPFGPSSHTSPSAAADRPLPNPGEFVDTIFQMVSPSYFETLGIPLKAGRGLDERDDDRSSAEPVVVISESLANHFWPGGDAVGRQLAFEFKGSPALPEPLWRRVVGVVGDIHLRDPRIPSSAIVFVPYTQVPYWLQQGESPTMTLLLRSSNGDPQSLFLPARQALLELAPNQPLFNGLVLDEAAKNLFGEPRQVTWLLTAFALLAAILVVVGVFGLVSYIVTSGTREIGIRMALGASRRTIILAILQRCALAMVVGLALGSSLVVFFLVPLVKNQLYGVASYDPGILFWAALLLTALGLLSALIPACRAIRVTPARSLRYE